MSASLRRSGKGLLPFSAMKRLRRYCRRVRRQRSRNTSWRLDRRPAAEAPRDFAGETSPRRAEPRQAQIGRGATPLDQHGRRSPARICGGSQRLVSSLDIYRYFSKIGALNHSCARSPRPPRIASGLPLFWRTVVTRSALSAISTIAHLLPVDCRLADRRT
jgi:hypothetical protein